MDCRKRNFLHVPSIISVMVIAVITRKDKAMTFLDFKITLQNYEDTEHIAKSGASWQSSAIMNLSNSKYSEHHHQNNKSQRRCRNCKTQLHDTEFCRKNPKGDRKNRWCTICKHRMQNTSSCPKARKMNKVEERDANADSSFVYFVWMTMPKTNTVKPSLLTVG